MGDSTNMFARTTLRVSNDGDGEKIFWTPEHQKPIFSYYVL